MPTYSGKDVLLLTHCGRDDGDESGSDDDQGRGLWLERRERETKDTRTFVESTKEDLQRDN